jgi:chromosome segregation ATPase
MDELKTRSFRVSEEVSTKLKELCENFDNQNSALSALLNAYEVQNARAVLTDRQTDIADYDTHIQAIQSAFLRSLEINENAEKRIKTEFINLLNSKDQTIVQLQTEKAQADEQVEKYKSAYGNLITSTEEKIKTMQTQVSESEKTLQSEKERANTEQKAREQAETISAMLSEQVEQLKAEVAKLTSKANRADELNDELSKLKSAYSDKEKALANAEIAKDTAVKYAIADTAGKYQRKIDEMQIKIDEMQTKQAEQLAILFQVTGKDKKE